MSTYSHFSSSAQWNYLGFSAASSGSRTAGISFLKSVSDSESDIATKCDIFEWILQIVVNLYRVTRVVADLGWVNLNVELLIYHCLPNSAQAGGSLAEQDEGTFK